MNIKHICAPLLALVFFAACDNIPEDKRFSKEPVSIAAQRNVLIQDFTGQRCPNCPTASMLIEELQNLYGTDHVVAVSIHGGGLSISSASSPEGLATEEGNAYVRAAGVSVFPTGNVDKQGLSAPGKWTEQVVSDLQKPALVKISVKNKMQDAGSVSSSVTMESQNGNLNGVLQAWLVEDSIRALQAMPAGGYNPRYLHMDVFRKTINSQNGEKVALIGKQPVVKNLSFTISDKWNAKHLSVVAFVYDSQNGVLNVVKQPVLPSPEK